jgi:Mg2+ and Co2+ transporter CorA
MKETVIQQQEGTIQWIDLINPSEDEIQDISRANTTKSKLRVLYL